MYPQANPQMGHRTSIDHSHNQSSEAKDLRQPNLMMQRILKNAEATIVMVGSVDFLHKPITAFVRLSKGHLLGNMMEVVLPVRFVFLLMGPQDPAVDYYEVGRAMASLMSYPVSDIT